MKRLAAYFMFAGALFAVPGIAAAQDLAAGDASFHNKCRACHAVGVGAKNTLGPETQRIGWAPSRDGRGLSVLARREERRLRLGSDQLRRVHRQSEGKIPGNKMVFAGIKDETEIANLWA